MKRRTAPAAALIRRRPPSQKAPDDRLPALIRRE